MALLEDQEIKRRLGLIAGWRREGATIVREFEKGDFAGSVRFVNAIAEPAERMNHHPDLMISWSRVTVVLSSHSEGGITAADFELAAAIDGLT